MKLDLSISECGWQYLSNDQDRAIVDFCNQEDNSSWHGHAVEYLDRYVTNYDTAIDIGANIGMFSVPLAKKYKNVHSFEINPEVYRCLVYNTQNYSNITTYNYGASNAIESVKIRIPEFKSGHGRIDTKGSIDALVCEVDDYNFNQVSLIKIDVEGHEYEVLQGCLNTIKKSKPILHIEIHSNRSEKSFLHRQKTFRMMKDLNYEIIDVRHNDYVFVYKG